MLRYLHDDVNTSYYWFSSDSSDTLLPYSDQLPPEAGAGEGSSKTACLLELQTKVKRRFAKSLQSQRRPLLALVGSRRFQPGEGPSRGLFRDCTTGCGTDGALHSTTADSYQRLQTLMQGVSQVIKLQSNTDTSDWLCKECFHYALLEGMCLDIF